MSKCTIGIVNECLFNNGGCAQACTDTNTSFQCSCDSGFNLNSDRRSCTDINECSLNTDDCDQDCTNTPGSFTCSCRSGFNASNGGRTCTSYQCDLNTDNCTCTNDSGTFHCDCTTGFMISGSNCVDIDECSAGTHNCQQICTNTPGGFTCSCMTGFRNQNACISKVSSRTDQALGFSDMTSYMHPCIMLHLSSCDMIST
jgi:fibulin 1/2